MNWIKIKPLNPIGCSIWLDLWFSGVFRNVFLDNRTWNLTQIRNEFSNPRYFQKFLSIGFIHFGVTAHEQTMFQLYCYNIHIFAAIYIVFHLAQLRPLVFRHQGIEFPKGLPIKTTKHHFYLQEYLLHIHNLQQRTGTITN